MSYVLNLQGMDAPTQKAEPDSLYSWVSLSLCVLSLVSVWLCTG